MIKVAAIYMPTPTGNKLHLKILWRTIRVRDYFRVGGMNLYLSTLVKCDDYIVVYLQTLALAYCHLKSFTTCCHANVLLNLDQLKKRYLSPYCHTNQNILKLQSLFYQPK